MESPRILLIQPPILDFTAFDFFLYPLGLIRLAAALSERGFAVELLDALDRFGAAASSAPPAPGWKRPTARADGCGHFLRGRIEPPPSLAHIPRRFHRFGLPPEALRASMAGRGRPAAVAVGCAMTYWYPGALETARIAKELWPGVPVLLGGAYAVLCREHALRLGAADFVQESPDLAPVFEFLSNNAPLPHPSAPPSEPFRAHALAGARPSAATATSSGCPNRCPYCASFRLQGPYRRRPAGEVAAEIEYLVRGLGREHIAFYDDALVDPGGSAFLELCALLRSKGLHERAAFHCPNAVSARSITREAARTMKETNFRTLRIGFETADPLLQEALGGKASNRELADAADHLHSAGFESKDLGVYLLVGLPGQSRESVEDSIRFVHRCGAKVRLAQYAPIPGTPLFEEAKRRSRLDLSEPLHHNKTLAAYRFDTLDAEGLDGSKRLAREGNEILSSVRGTRPRGP